MDTTMDPEEIAVSTAVPGDLEPPDDARAQP